MTKPLRRLLVAGGAHLPVPAAITPKSTVVLTYHGVPKKADGHGFSRSAFEQHVAFLKQNFTLVGRSAVDERPRSHAPIEVLLTFDDGFKNHAENVVPILRRHGVPAMFFVPSRHAAAGQYLWFVYLRMLERYFRGNGFMFRGQFVDMSPGTRRATMATLWSRLLALTPHPSAMYLAIEGELPPLEDFVDQPTIDDEAAGMTVEQVEDIAADPLFEVGAHTVDHPFLPRCEPEEQRRQIIANKEWIERICGRCETIAYPASDYDQAVVRRCRDAGFVVGYGGERSRGVGESLDVSRIGVYYPSLTELSVKVWWSQAINYWHGLGRQRWSEGEPAKATESSHA